MEIWQDFLQYEHASEVLMSIGGLLFIFSAWKILASSLKLIIWVLFAFIGGASASYGFKNSPYDLPAIANAQLSELKQITPEIPHDVLQVLCTKLDVLSE
ncbi:MAG: hypothetical protein AB8B79_03115 [Granulosicoccus sp.]